MFTDIFHKTDAVLLTGILFFSMLLFVWIGFRARKVIDRPGKVANEIGITGLENGMMGLLAFVLAITFGISAGKYDKNREVIVSEANAIGTAVLRADLYADSTRDAFRKDFKDYLDARIEYYEAGADTGRIWKAKRTGSAISAKIWKRAMDASKAPGMLIPSNQMIPALNEMIDITTTREAILKSRVPDIILLALFILALTSSFLAGFEARRIELKDWLVTIGFSLLVCLVIYVILDLGRPRRGLIRSDIGEEAMIELRELFQP